jgi:hypothetical protein
LILAVFGFKFKFHGFYFYHEKRKTLLWRSIFN